MSCEKTSALYAEASRYIRYELELQPLTIEQRSTYIDTFFSRFNKVSSKKRNSDTNTKSFFNVLNSNPDSSVSIMNHKTSYWFYKRIRFYFFLR